MSHDGVGLRAVMRSVAFLTAGALAVPALAACSADEEVTKPLAAQDIAPATRDRIADGGTLRWAVDAGTPDPQHVPGGRRRRHLPDRLAPYCPPCTASTPTAPPSSTPTTPSRRDRRRRAQAGSAPRS